MDSTTAYTSVKNPLASFSGPFVQSIIGRLQPNTLMAPYQKPTVEEVEDEHRKYEENGIRVQINGMGNTTYSTAADAKRLRKRKCPWESSQRLGKATAIPASCR